MVSSYVKSHSTGKDSSATVVQQLLNGADTQQTIAVHTPLLLVAFHAYSKDLYGCASMERDDLLCMLRDAMLTSTEISQYLIYELFQHFCVVRKMTEEAAATSRRELDARPRDGHTRRANRSVKIMTSGPGSSMGSEVASRKPDVHVLLFDGFIRFLCVLCSFKQPNPLIPFGKRLRVFLRRSLLRPLALKVDQIAPLLNASRSTTKEDGTEGKGGDM
ncbi:hypothetical protein STCU_12250 [Strigomonas culicis]|uniref:Uncharacterized protein n=1 Tax=Strigomonas culicis TaxID=28005 RepID=S9TE22_9TRYP|nr:hypothetical protein STCU_12250 [Strigomonas culicis]|eukprot:EPY15204.1 hypothetical protein STCU_12250 [Strigomonas culicis]